MGIGQFFQIIKEVLAGNVFKKHKEVGRRFEGTIKSDDVRVGRKRLVNVCLREWELDRKFQAVKAEGTYRKKFRVQKVLVELGLN